MGENPLGSFLTQSLSQRPSNTTRAGACESIKTKPGEVEQTGKLKARCLQNCNTTHATALPRACNLQGMPTHSGPSNLGRSGVCVKRNNCHHAADSMEGSQGNETLRPLSFSPPDSHLALNSYSHLQCFKISYPSGLKLPGSAEAFLLGPSCLEWIAVFEK